MARGLVEGIPRVTQAREADAAVRVLACEALVGLPPHLIALAPGCRGAVGAAAAKDSVRVMGRDGENTGSSNGNKR